MSLKEALIEEERFLLTRLVAVRELMLLYKRNNINKPKVSLLDIKSYVSEQGINSKSRKQSLVHQRFYLATYIKTKHNLTLKNVGSIFGVTHAVVVHYLGQHKAKYREDIRYTSNISVLCELFPL